MAEPNDVARDAPNDAAKMLPSPYMSALDLPAGKPVTMVMDPNGFGSGQNLDGAW